MLIVVILVQNPKGGGLSSEFGGSSSQMFGVQKTDDILEKLTWGFFTFIVVGALVTGIFLRGEVNTIGNDALDVERSMAPAASGAAMPTVPSAAPATGGALEQAAAPATDEASATAE